VERDDGSYYYEMVRHPLANATLKEIQAHPWPDPYDPGRVEGLREKILEVRRSTDKAIMVKFSNSIWEQSWWQYVMQAWMVDLIANPEIVTAIMDKVTDVAVGLMEAGMEAVGDLVDIVRLSGEDLGTQIAPMISHACSTGWQAAPSACGAVPGGSWPEKNPAGKADGPFLRQHQAFYPILIEMGLDILDPIQPCPGDGAGRAQRDFGDRLVFHGGSTSSIRFRSGPGEVCGEVRRYIRALAPGGGYIVAPAHNVQSDVPPANLVAIRDAIESFGHYPIR
jgi:uroporphyrinogen decarboxylase